MHCLTHCSPKYHTNLKSKSLQVNSTTKFKLDFFLIIELQLRDYIESNVSHVTQSGFRPEYSCETALLRIADDIVRAKDISRCGHGAG